MARVLYVWELGGGIGHISRAAPIIEGLRREGHEVWVALRDLSRAITLLHSVDLKLLQCPLWLHELHGAPESATYPELLFRAGFLDATGLEGLVRGWRELFRLADPSLLIADHSPTAFLAARGLPFRRALIGNGFFSPPRVTPLPSFRTWEKIDPARLAGAEAKALAVANTVLGRLAAPPLERICDLIDVDENFLCTWPELDHYQGRTGQPYWGPTMERERGLVPQWPEGQEPRLFCYLKSDTHVLDGFLAALRRLPVRALLFVQGLDPRRLGVSSRLQLVSQPVRMGEAAAQADIVVCNGGEGTVAAALLAGKPVFALPMHAEQLITAFNLERMGAGLHVRPGANSAQIEGQVRRLLGEPAFGSAARDIAARYADFVPEAVTQRMLGRCEELIALGPRRQC